MRNQVEGEREREKPEQDEVEKQNSEEKEMCLRRAAIQKAASRREGCSASLSSTPTGETHFSRVRLREYGVCVSFDSCRF